jgi:hypothetical protein
LQILEEHEACGADEMLPTRLKDDSDDEDDADSDDDDHSIDGDSATQQQPRQPNRTTASQHAAAKHTLEERELRNRPIAESVVQQWLLHGDGRLAQALRVCLAMRHSVNVQAEGSVERALLLLHNVESEVPRNTADLTIKYLARRLEEGFNIGKEAVNIDLLYGELRTAVQSLNVDFQHSGLPHTSAPESGDPTTNLEQDLDALLAGQAGTTDRPFEQPARGTIPLSEHRTKGYTTLAFPTLFPFGAGDFSETRKYAVTWEQWSKHLQKFYDGRFSTHSRFPYFMLNTHEREVANRQSGLFVTEADKRLTVGDLRKMSASQKQDVAKRVSKYGATLRNTPAFMGERKKELHAMCEQIGDPNVSRAAPHPADHCSAVGLHLTQSPLLWQVFATNSHADTYDPYLALFIKTWAEIPDGTATDPDVDRELDISDNERYGRRAANLKRYPHIVATYFHMKTELYVEYICKGIMGADAYWMRCAQSCHRTANNVSHL